jgi:hypothetical protein
MLSLPNLKNPFEVEIDASGYAMGVFLMQGGSIVFYHCQVFIGVVFN